MNKRKQAAILLFSFGVFYLFAYYMDKPGQTAAETIEVAQTEDVAEITQEDEKGNNKAYRKEYETRAQADDAEDIDLHDEKYYLAVLEGLAGDGTMANEMIYQFQRPYSFILHMTEPTGGLAYDEYRFRNIAEEDLEELTTYDTDYRGYGEAYIADCVLDKYIREYGGEDTKYHVRIDTEWRKNYSGKALYDTYCFDIYNEDVRLYVTWNGYIDGIVTVLIKGNTSVKADEEEYISYARYSLVDYRNKHYHREEGKYWMLINPDSISDVYCYRNVNPQEHTYHAGNAQDEALRYYIADRVIDKYIRDYLGSDTVYHVESLRKMWGEEESEGRYAMELIGGEEVLRVKYAPDSWLVDVEVLSKAEYEAYYMAALNELAGDNLFLSRAMIDVLKYQIKQPCTFLLYPSEGSGEVDFEEYQYRNIEKSDLKKIDENGTEWIGGWDAYIVDCVLDKYIREYGGEDTLYHYKITAKPEGAEGLYSISFMEIYNEDVKLYVIWNQYISGIVNVLIEGDENAQPHMQEFISYAQYSVTDYRDKKYDTGGAYWMLMNPEVTRNERCYRNIDPEDVAFDKHGIENAVLLCDVADMVLNQYIIEWLGSDTIYQIEGNMNEDRGEYFIKLTGGEEILQVSYQPDSWLVRVTVIDRSEK